MSFISLIHFVLCSHFLNSCENLPRLLRAYSGDIRVKFIYLSFYSICIISLEYTSEAVLLPFTLIIKVGFRMRTVLYLFPSFGVRSFAVLPRLPTISRGFSQVSG